jgi:ligand-binding sensor domain-containing protein
MAIKLSLAGVAAVAVAAALVAAYQMGRSNAAASAEALPPASSVLRAGPKPGAGDGREGKVGAAGVDASQKFTHFRVGNKNVKRIFADGDVVWVGTSGGLVRYDTRGDDYKLFDARSGLLSNGVFYVGRINNRLAVGTYGGGLSLMDPKTQAWETYNVPEGLGDAFVYDVLQAKNGDLWIATWSGVNRVRGGDLKDRSKWELHTVESTKGGLPNDWVYGLAEGKDGEMWLGTEGGLARFKDGRWDNWNHAKGLGAPYERVKDAIDFKTDPAKVSDHHARQKQETGLTGIDVAYNPNYIVSLAIDANGVVWAGTWGGGLSRFDGKTWTQYTVAEGLPGNHVFMLHVDPRGTMWIGTNNGLARARPEGGFEVMTTQEGLFANAVFSMTTTQDGSRWVGGFGGVAKIKPG